MSDAIRCTEPCPRTCSGCKLGPGQSHDMPVSDIVPKSPHAEGESCCTSNQPEAQVRRPRKSIDKDATLAALFNVSKQYLLYGEGTTWERL
jgi:hypothetical protein